MSSAVVVDRWDGPDLERAETVPAFVTQRARLAERFVWGADALDDIFWVLFKARPELRPSTEVDRSLVVGHVLVSLLARNPAVVRLRRSTMRDATGAALAAARLAPKLEEAAGATDLGALETGAGDEEVSAAAGSALGVLEEACEAVAEESEALAARLDTPQARAVTDLFGRLRSSMFAERAEMDGFGVEPVDVEVGGDLSRMVGAELLSMLQGDLFYARLGDGALRQYAMHGEDQAGRGGIVLCVDCSSSMTWPHQGYTRELWASALKLHLLQTAIREDRPMHVIDFSTSVSYHRFVDPAERVPLRILEAATDWYGGGTDFVRPLRKAIEVLVDERDRSADVVFVSDGECSLSPRMRQTYQRATRVRGVRTWGVQLGATPGALSDFCDRIFEITDLTSGRELGDLLNAVESTTAPA